MRSVILSVGLLASANSVAIAQSSEQSLLSELRVTGSVIGRVFLDANVGSNISHSEEAEAMLQFFSDGMAEYDFNSVAGPSYSCSGRLEVFEEFEDDNWQTVGFLVESLKSTGDACPQKGFIYLSRRPDATKSDPIKITYQPDVNAESLLAMSGGLFLTAGIPLLQDYKFLTDEEAELSNAMEEWAAEDDWSTAPSVSVGYPIYDGVYVGLVDGSYVQMELLVRKASSLHFGGMPYAITRPFGDPSENRPAPVVDVDEVKSIYVKSGSDIVTFIMPVFDAEGLLFQGGSPVPNAWVNIGRTPFSSSQFQDIFAASDCAFTPQQMNRISLSRTEYELIFENSRISPRNLATAAVNTKWSASKPVYDPSMPDKCVGLVRSRGFAVLVEGPAHKGIQTVLGPQRGSVFWVRFRD